MTPNSAKYECGILINSVYFWARDDSKDQLNQKLIGFNPNSGYSVPWGQQVVVRRHRCEQTLRSRHNQVYNCLYLPPGCDQIWTAGIKNQKLYWRLKKKNIFFLLLTRWSGVAIANMKDLNIARFVVFHDSNAKPLQRILVLLRSVWPRPFLGPICIQGEAEGVT